MSDTLPAIAYSDEFRSRFDGDDEKEEEDSQREAAGGGGGQVKEHDPAEEKLARWNQPTLLDLRFM